MTTDLKEFLNKPDEPEAKALLELVMKDIKRSKNHMSGYYSTWDTADDSFRMLRQPDEQDKKAERRKEPKKVTLPFVHSQVLTWIAFCFMLYNQREYFYNLEGSGPEDSAGPENDAQKIVAGDLQTSKWNSILYQLLLDLGKWGLCISKTQWETKEAEVLTGPMQPAGATLSGLPTAPDVALTPQLKVVYEGTKIRVISPYHFFPDPDFPLTRLQEGNFCASEDLFSRTELKRLEAAGVIASIDDLPTPAQEWTEKSRFRAAAGESETSSDTLRNNMMSGNAPASLVITESQKWIIPSEVKLDGDKVLGPETRPVLYLFWVVNWSRVVRAEPMNYPHNQFTFDVGQFNSDQHKTINEGLGELVQPMQDVATWLLNSRVASVRKVIDSRLIVNTSAIEESDIVNRRPIIRTKSTAMGTLDMFVKQLTVQDTTQGHMSVDIPAMWGFVQNLTGTNENSSGQFSSGRRDATQSRAANAGAASRNKTVASVLWETLFVPQGQKILMNAQGSMSFEEFKRRVGDDATEERFAAFNKRAQGVYNNYDFTVFDGTLPSEKGFIAQSMQELLLGLFENPMAQQLLQDPTFRKLLLQICELRGIPNPSKFLPEIQPTLPPVIPPTNGTTPTPTVVPAPVSNAA